MKTLENTKILVTGGAGLIGSHIVDELVKERASVIVFDNFIRGKKENLDWAINNGNVEIFQGDICDKGALKEAFKGVDYAFHEAAMWLRICEAEPRKAVEVNILGTFNVLEAAVEANIKKIICASSSSVYGDGLYLPTDEKHPFNNRIFYGATKVADEQLMRAFYNKYGLEYIGFRYLNIYGPRQPYEAAYMDVIMHFLNRIKDGLPPQIHGDGSQTVDLVYVEDCARANIMALKSNIKDDFFNVAGGRQTSLKELAELLCELMGRADLRLEFVNRDSKLVTKRHGCPQKSKELLGFQTTTSVRDGMKKVIEWRRLSQNVKVG